jgi:hypothetical protein
MLLLLLLLRSVMKVVNDDRLSLVDNDYNRIMTK